MDIFWWHWEGCALHNQFRGLLISFHILLQIILICKWRERERENEDQWGVVRFGSCWHDTGTLLKSESKNGQWTLGIEHIRTNAHAQAHVCLERTKHLLSPHHHHHHLPTSIRTNYAPSSCQEVYNKKMHTEPSTPIYASPSSLESKSHFWYWAHVYNSSEFHHPTRMSSQQINPTAPLRFHFSPVILTAVIGN